MSDDQSKIAESIRSGRYFTDAREWYQAIYIGPISERTFFLLIAGLSAVVCIASVLAFGRLLPVVIKPAIILNAEDHTEDSVRQMHRLKNVRTEDPNIALERFFVRHYVLAREEYSAADLQRNAKFVYGQSDKETYNSYFAQQDSSNPQSLASTYGANGSRLVTVKSVHVHLDDGEKGTATAQFTAEDITESGSVKSEWTAKLEYNYTKLTVDMVTNEETGESETKVSDPQFQVTSYVVQKN